MTSDSFKFKKQPLKSVISIINAHLEQLTIPFDSYLESKLDSAEIIGIYFDDSLIGYAGVVDEIIYFFHIILNYFQHAPQAFEALLDFTQLNRVMILTFDPMLNALIMEWDYRKERDACWFVDAGRIEKPDTSVMDAVFRVATLDDIETIEEKSGDFFDMLEERIQDATIFILEQYGAMMGVGIIEHGHYFKDLISIGMFCDKSYRRKGVAQTILWHLKELVYNDGKKPTAGCWYYNALSRRALERANMRAVGKGYIAIISGKENPPLMTGNRPGKLVKND